MTPLRSDWLPFRLDSFAAHIASLAVVGRVLGRRATLVAPALRSSIGGVGLDGGADSANVFTVLAVFLSVLATSFTDDLDESHGGDLMGYPPA